MTLSKRYSSQTIERAKLLHWSGPYKPWQQGIAAPYSSVWRKYFVPDPTGKYHPRKKRVEEVAINRTALKE